LQLLTCFMFILLSVESNDSVPFSGRNNTEFRSQESESRSQNSAALLRSEPRGNQYDNDSKENAKSHSPS
jgi:hypothetical protein